VFAGGNGIPLHWSLQADSRALCFRFAPDSPGEPGPQWSHPIELENALNSSSRFISLPVRPPSATEPPPLISLGDDRGDEEEGAAGASGKPRGRQGSYLRDITTLETAAAPSWELHGLQTRVARRVKHYSRSVFSPLCMLVLRISLRSATLADTAALL
jgi:hypothetical protein